MTESFPILTSSWPRALLPPPTGSNSSMASCIGGCKTAASPHTFLRSWSAVFWSLHMTLLATGALTKPGHSWKTVSTPWSVRWRPGIRTPMPWLSACESFPPKPTWADVAAWGPWHCFSDRQYGHCLGLPLCQSFDACMVIVDLFSKAVILSSRASGSNRVIDPWGKPDKFLELDEFMEKLVLKSAGHSDSQDEFMHTVVAKRIIYLKTTSGRASSYGGEWGTTQKLIRDKMYRPWWNTW